MKADIKELKVWRKNWPQICCQLVYSWKTSVNMDEGIKTVSRWKCDFRNRRQSRSEISLTWALWFQSQGSDVRRWTETKVSGQWFPNLNDFYIERLQGAAGVSSLWLLSAEFHHILSVKSLITGSGSLAASTIMDQNWLLNLNGSDDGWYSSPVVAALNASLDSTSETGVHGFVFWYWRCSTGISTGTCCIYSEPPLEHLLPQLHCCRHSNPLTLHCRAADAEDWTSQNF